MKAKTLFEKTFIIGLLCSLLALTSCGGSNSTTELNSDLPSPVAKEIKGNTLVEAPPGKDPAPVTELALLPTITVNQRQFADPNVLLNLNATVTAAAGASIVTTLWTQVTGPTVRIPSPLQLNNEIIIPDVVAATTLEFRLTAQDSKGKINSATVSILVKPVPYFVKVIGGVFNEADKVAVFSLRLNAASNLPVTVSYSTQDGSAINNNDYTLTSGQVTFAAGEVSKTISVTLLEDTLEEDDETFSLQVTAMDAGITYNSSGTAIIHSSNSALLPQTIRFTTTTPAPIKINSQYTNPLLDNVGTGTVTYSSTNPQVATVDTNGLVTALAPGNTTIAAIKQGDTIYAPAWFNYYLQVVGNGSAPVVTIAGGNTSLALGQTLQLHASVVDAEDGQFADSTTDQSRVWYSSSNTTYDQTSGYGSDFTFSASGWGSHAVFHSAIDSDGNSSNAEVRVFVGNIAPQAIATETSASSSACSSTATAINDSNLTTRFTPGCGAGSFLYLTWPSPVTFDIIEIYSANPPTYNDGLIIESFDSATGTWMGEPYIDEIIAPLSYRIIVPDKDNLVTTNLRIRQPVPDSILEIAVYNTQAGTPAENPSTASSSRAQSSLASSSAASSSLATSSKANSSSAASSKLSSSLAASSKASSSLASSVKTSSAASSSAKSAASQGIILL